MEDFSEHSPPPEQAPPAGTNPLNVGFALVTAFALGLALGFFGRPTVIDDVPIQVVVTVVPNNSGEAVAQIPASTAEETTSSADTSHAAQAMTEDGAATTISADADSPPALTPIAEPPAEATPTLMDFVMSDARHWQGDEVAPVVIVEFSDFK
jgi:hypothetical protein